MRRSEEQTYIFFLDECEGKNCVFTMYCITTMYVIFSEEHGECTLEDICIFFQEPGLFRLQAGLRNHP